MKLVRNGAFVEDDFIAVGDEDALPDGPAIVSLERWQAERDTLIARNAPIGVRLQSGQEPGSIAGDLDRIDLVALEFPVYRNGRAYSYARLLRERYGFKGEVRAVGNVLRDQFQFMIRCGFDALEVADNITPEIWAENAGSFSLFYQPSADGKETVLSLRQRLAARAREKATA
ncbi:MAG: oxidoreductase [Alphaproteobacteria bacterium HGW-Alphaproteobacteria-12]|nr:MAG: oxidoreductase [Alphaproteobacteria bacterium HGW-Alphaproteobacteria-12]